MTKHHTIEGVWMVVNGQVYGVFTSFPGIKVLLVSFMEEAPITRDVMVKRKMFLTLIKSWLSSQLCQKVHIDVTYLKVMQHLLYRSSLRIDIRRAEA